MAIINKYSSGSLETTYENQLPKKCMRTRWQSRRTWAHLLSLKHQNHNCWTTINKKDSDLPKKIFYTQRQRRSHNKMVGGVLSWYNEIPYPPGGWPTNWKIIISQRFSHRSESWEPYVRLPSLGYGIRRRSPQSIWLWRPVGLECRSSTGLGETETPLLEGTHKVSRAQGPGQSGDSIRAWARPTCGSSSVSWGDGGLSVAHWWWMPQGILISMSSPGGCHFGTETWPHPATCKLQWLDATGQTTNRVSPTHQETGCLKLSWANSHL